MEKVSYQFYMDTYHGGAISETEWPAAEREARANLEKLGRSCTVRADTEDAMKNAVCAVAEVLMDDAGSRGVGSASIGSVSVSYSAEKQPSLARRVSSAAALYVEIYRGVGG